MMVTRNMTQGKKPTSVFALPPAMYDVLYAGEPRDRIDTLSDVIGGPVENSDLLKFDRLAEVDILFAGWQSPTLDASLLARMPRLRAVFYASGSIKHLVTDAFWKRGIVITSAAQANAIPVAEYAHAAIILSLKRAWFYERAYHRERKKPGYVPMPGAFRSTVGLVSLGAIGRRVAEKLHDSDIRVVAYDPYVRPELAESLNIQMMDLAGLFRCSDVVSLHTPLLKETEGLITGALIDSMKPNATLLNTSRAQIVRETEMIDVLLRRPDLTAVLDLTDPYPPVPGSPLYELPNIVLTPHIAGSMGDECKRLGWTMAEEAARYVSGQPLQWSITREQEQRMA